MGECTHPRSQGYTDDEGRSRCGACGDMWSDELKRFVPPAAVAVTNNINTVIDAMYSTKLRIVIVDIRNGKIYENGSNIDIEEEDQQRAIEAIMGADVIVEISQDDMFIRKDTEHATMLLLSTKSQAQMSNEKALREKAARIKPSRDLEVGDHPVDSKFKRVWG